MTTHAGRESAQDNNIWGNVAETATNSAKGTAEVNVRVQPPAKVPAKPKPNSEEDKIIEEEINRMNSQQQPPKQKPNDEEIYEGGEEDYVEISKEGDVTEVLIDPDNEEY